ncbi:SDR family oxidoreductase [Streptomyces sp. DSM 40750]|uniref:SDR family oxidoreductase n=1 Tax=Streptomyces sp. DSM 40750 TaxID=2801030 RepID=UPI00214BB3E1|nr:SDR family oxidoreductase [Streptomyces sp. DSM 40750]UUU27802.1 SDR family oxidoreductase [Streptomyces sp. DSM 40750]UUU28389.1 SDR family oxidoreductase [Streptomyces sp. DSM 40750]
MVLGSGTGIGRATARAFLEQGACVAVLGRRAEPLHETVAGFDTKHVQVIEADVTDADALDGAVGVVRLFDRLDVIVDDAGTSEPSGVDTLNDTWERLRSVNLDGVIRLARPTVP